MVRALTFDEEILLRFPGEVSSHGGGAVTLALSCSIPRSLGDRADLSLAFVAATAATIGHSVDGWFENYSSAMRGQMIPIWLAQRV